MPVLAIINAKGGSGKSTVATSISAYAAKAGIKLMLGDLDPQQSVRTWLRLRDPDLPVISGWLLDAGRVFRPPAGVTHAILDTPSGLTGLHLARVVMASNLVIIPVAASAFDRDAAEECIESLRLLPRVVSGLCVIACLGMRIPQGSPAEKITRAWAERIGVKFLGVVRYSPTYSTLVDKGSSVFDDKGSDIVGLRNDWKPLLDWLGESYFGSLCKRDALRETHKIVDEWPRHVPNFASFQEKAVTLPLATEALVNAPVSAPVVLAPYTLTIDESLKSVIAIQAMEAAEANEAAEIMASMNTAADLSESAEASDLPDSDEMAPDELVVLVVDGALDLDLPKSPPTGLFASMNRGFKRLWGAP